MQEGYTRLAGCHGRLAGLGADTACPRHDLRHPPGRRPLRPARRARRRRRGRGPRRHLHDARLLRGDLGRHAAQPDRRPGRRRRSAGHPGRRRRRTSSTSTARTSRSRLRDRRRQPRPAARARRPRARSRPRASTGWATSGSRATSSRQWLRFDHDPRTTRSTTPAHAGTGEGMYLGCNDEACRVHATRSSSDNYVHDLGGSQGDGIEIKTGALRQHRARQRDRPLRATPASRCTASPARGARNVVERNLVWGTRRQRHPGGRPDRRPQQHRARRGGERHPVQAEPELLRRTTSTIVHNTIVGAGAACLKTNDWAGQTGQLVANNALYCEGGTALDLNGGAPAAMLAGNVGLGTSNAADRRRAGVSAAADLGDPATAHVYPPAGSALIDAGDPAHAATDDFNGTHRSDGTPDVGAYERSTDANPGWLPDRGLQDSCSGGKPGRGNVDPRREGADPGRRGGADPGRADLGRCRNRPSCDRRRLPDRPGAGGWGSIAASLLYLRSRRSRR